MQQLVQSITEFLKAIGSWFAKQGDFLEWFAAFGAWSAGATTVLATWVALYLGIAANHAKLKATGVFAKSNGGIIYGIQMKIKNVRAKDVTIKCIAMCRIKKMRSLGLSGFKRKFESCRGVFSQKEGDTSFFGSAFYMDRTKQFPEQEEVLESGKTCTRLITIDFFADSHDYLLDLAETKKEAKTVQFVVCTDYGNFPVESDQSVKKFLVDVLTAAIEREKRNPTFPRKNLRKKWWEKLWKR